MFVAEEIVHMHLLVSIISNCQDTKPSICQVDLPRGLLHSSNTTALNSKTRNTSKFSPFSSIRSAMGRRKLFVCAASIFPFVSLVFIPWFQIGINYHGQQGQLRGCINDVQNVVNFLISKSSCLSLGGSLGPVIF
jgi:hypothetical protein